MKKFLLSLSLILSVLVLTACSAISQKDSQTTLSSMPTIEGVAYYGDIPAQPKKVVSLNFANTGYLLQLGFDVVGATSYDLENPAFAEQLKGATAVTSEDLEAIAALEPDLIVTGSTDEKIEQLAEIAPTISLEYGKHSYAETLIVFGQIFGQEAAVEEWQTAWKENVANAAKEIKAKTGDNATFTIMGYLGQDLYLFGNNWGRGGEIIYQELAYTAPQKVKDKVFGPGFLAVSQEVLPDYAGDYIILAVEDESVAAGLLNSDLWKNLPAVQNNRVIKVDSKAFYFNDPISLEYQLNILKEAITK
ncbi:ABC transporter substrate-binding protein [Streptococcus iners]|uniref:ABC transporter substrate-binding protein n=1 Tax=Streptococcus iners subsp. hyiners TaxID=3028083 RepID=A0AA97ABK8_9STRE|nr:ABC transporter substrate-binding protein [Streptococcus sp. 29892]MCK4029700.1 ABC transporter substrate-binding protein [Streptococcus suis]WNY48471.1 ABC transporter substrate-binding protein [Streptococcus sp. 29892]